jgi:DNA-binding YbaB/EbfC family protein
MQNMRLLQQMQERLAKAQEELGKEVVEGTAGGGAVKIVMSGHQKVQSVVIDPEVVDPADVEMLQDLMVAAINEAVGRSHELASKRMGALTGGLKIPGLT